VRLFRRVETFFYAGDGDASEVLDGFDTFTEEGIRQVFGVGLELGEASQCSKGSLSVLYRRVVSTNDY